LSRAYNPLFIYGGSGLGKTHLLHAIGLAAFDANPQIKLLYISTEEFTNEFIKALRLERTQSFREKYRTVDLLLVDDIHQLQGKAQTQEEFFHTFNVLHKKAQKVNAYLADDVAWFIASRVKNNIRTMEGCLNRMLAMHSLTGRAINLQLAKEVLKPLINTEDRVITADLIMEVVAQYYQLKADDLKSKDNSRKIVLPRQVAMFLCKQMTALSLPEIGRVFGGKHHSTVIHSVNKTQESLKRDPILQNEINTLIETIKTT
jgi:chromosomal replication initiator protein